jgi:hypothetical protein
MEYFNYRPEAFFISGDVFSKKRALVIAASRAPWRL